MIPAQDATSLVLISLCGTAGLSAAVIYAVFTLGLPIGLKTARLLTFMNPAERIPSQMPIGISGSPWKVTISFKTFVANAVNIRSFVTTSHIAGMPNTETGASRLTAVTVRSVTFGDEMVEAETLVMVSILVPWIAAV
jgi:hypothetical protein